MRQLALTSAIAFVAVIGTGAITRASDCGFFLGQIENLKAACASGSYCADLQAFQERARAEDCLADDSTPRDSSQASPPVAVARPPSTYKPPSNDRLVDCSAIPSDVASYQMLVALKYSAKLRALNEGLDTLRQQRAELESTFNLDFGDAGSIRSGITYMAAITKTAADLIDDILAYLPEGKLGNSVYSVFKWKLSSREAYEAITKGKLITESVSEDSLQAAIDVLLESATVNPAVTTAKLLNDLQKNGAELAEMPEKFETARAEYDRAVKTLDGQIANIAKKIRDAKATSVQSGGDALFNRYMEIREICLVTQASGPELRPLQ